MCVSLFLSVIASLLLSSALSAAQITYTFTGTADADLNCLAIPEAVCQHVSAAPFTLSFTTDPSTFSGIDTVPITGPASLKIGPLGGGLEIADPSLPLTDIRNIEYTSLLGDSNSLGWFRSNPLSPILVFHSPIPGGFRFDSSFTLNNIGVEIHPLGADLHSGFAIVNSVGVVSFLDISNVSLAATFDPSTTATTPEPSTMGLLAIAGLGLIGVGTLRRGVDTSTGRLVNPCGSPDTSLFQNDGGMAA